MVHLLPFLFCFSVGVWGITILWICFLFLSILCFVFRMQRLRWLCFSSSLRACLRPRAPRRSTVTTWSRQRAVPMPTWRLQRSLTRRCQKHRSGSQFLQFFVHFWEKNAFFVQNIFYLECYFAHVIQYKPRHFGVKLTLESTCIIIMIENKFHK